MIQVCVRCAFWAVASAGTGAFYTALYLWASK